MMNDDTLFATPVRSIAVNASAGFGKTENLARRILAMASAAKSPEKLFGGLVALTFTRAAAGEIYERLLMLLCDALTDCKKFDALTASWQDSEFGRDTGATPEKLTALLRLLIRRMNELQIGTIDGFMMSAVSSSPFELGLPGGVTMSDPAQGREQTERLLRSVLSAEGMSRELAEAVREASLGRESRGYFDLCVEQIKRFDRFYCERNIPDVWNKFSGFFSERNTDELRRTFAVWHQYYLNNIESAPVTAARKMPALDGVLEKCAAPAPSSGALFNGADCEILRTFFQNWEHVESNVFDVKDNTWMKKLPDEIKDAVKKLLRAAGKYLIACASRRNEGMRRLFCAYAAARGELIRTTGTVAFSDLPRLLSDTGNEWVSDLQFRLNCRLRHWLLDEFQDTSAEQLTVLNSVIDDVSDGESSLYIVGDVKQAIYHWRNGDRRLMAAETAEFGLEQHSLPKSYRYGKNICRALNRVFSPAAFSRSPASPAVAADWLGSESWVPHQSAVTRPDCFEAVLFNAAKDFSIASYAKFIAGRIRELGILENHLSCAILVRNNNLGLDLREALAAVDPTLAASLVWEGSEPLGSEKLIAGILALLVAAEHPGDTVSFAAAAMNPPLAALTGRPDINAELIRQLTLGGFHGAISWVLDRVDRSMCDCFADGNAELLLKLARDFDSTAAGAQHDAVAFREAAWNFTKSDLALAGKIRIMTIHHSKGLSFDVTFSALKENNCNVNWGAPDLNDFIVKTDGAGHIEWILDAPHSEGMLFPEIRDAVLECHHEAIFEDLCNLYVSLTRAKRHVCVLLPPAAADETKVFRASSFVHRGLFSEAEPDDDCTKYDDYCVLKIGDDWWSAHQPDEPPPPRRLSVEFDAAPVRRLPRVEPSAHNLSLRLLLTAPLAGGSAELGTRIHEHLEKYGLSPAAEPEVEEQLKRCRANSEVVELLDNRDGWTEKSFEVELDGKWISGRFDRVNFRRNAAGGIAGATLVDYKSDQCAAPEERAGFYAAQMTVYRQALKKLLELPDDAVSVVLIFTASGRVVRL
ncbi:MAG: UvrD-helicase domain-containing protein [Victivallaceae bacterium]|nr:UvrD-helicase domain-containing protein [Victivallaceae bacterium]